MKHWTFAHPLRETELRWQRPNPRWWRAWLLTRWRRDFGAQHDAYRAAVPGRRPRLHPFRAPTES